MFRFKPKDKPYKLFDGKFQYILCFGSRVVGSVTIPYFDNGIQIKNGCNYYEIIKILEDETSKKYYMVDEDGDYQEIKEKFMASKYIKSYGEGDHVIEFFYIEVDSIDTDDEKFKEFYLSLK